MLLKKSQNSIFQGWVWLLLLLGRAAAGHPHHHYHHHLNIIVILIIFITTVYISDNIFIIMSKRNKCLTKTSRRSAVMGVGSDRGGGRGGQGVEPRQGGQVPRLPQGGGAGGRGQPGRLGPPDQGGEEGQAERE